LATIDARRDQGEALRKIARSYNVNHARARRSFVIPRQSTRPAGSLQSRSGRGTTGYRPTDPGTGPPKTTASPAAPSLTRRAMIPCLVPALPA
jgi:hypothetical protein